jgi:NADP-dependent 3-hydroxy acid dehydrogenase YdfG
MSSLAGRRVLVAGASSGLGAAVVADCTKAGATVGAIARRQDVLESVTGPAGAVAAAADLGDAAATLDAVARIAEALGGLDAVVITAGTMLHSPIGDGRIADWAETYRTNPLATLHVVHAVLPYLREAEHADLVLFSSVAADDIPGADYGVYASAKAAQATLAKALQIELAASAPNVRVTLVKPGLMNTEGLGQGTRNPEVRDFVLAVKERLGLPPETVAAEIRHLLELPSEMTIPAVTIMPTAQV